MQCVQRRVLIRNFRRFRQKTATGSHQFGMLRIFYFYLFGILEAVKQLV